jgi:hypothetical protein
MRPLSSHHLPPEYEATAQVFADLRRYLGQSPTQIAAYLGCPPAVIVDLEAGGFDRLPPQPERYRIIMAYTAMAGINGVSVWNRVEEAVKTTNGNRTAPIPVYQAPSYHVPPYEAPGHASIDDEERDPPGIWQRAKDHAVQLRASVNLPALSARVSSWSTKAQCRRTGALPRWRTALVIMGLATLGAGTQSSILEAGAAKLPAPVGRLVRSANDALLIQFGPTLQGLPWIKASDPRSRRSDKLPVIKR